MAIWYLITGASGHLGNTLVDLFSRQGKNVRALVLPDDKLADVLKGKAKVFFGNTVDKASLLPFFQMNDGDSAIVIHCAAVISIASRFNQAVHDVNVGGTRNVLELCVETSVSKLVHVSSVHAIPELPSGQTITETNHFDPNDVVGLYAKTKSEATQLVLAAAKKGLNASVVHPSGICGPNDYRQGHLTQLLIDYCKGKLIAGIGGGYDFVDVRDVAAGVASCCEEGEAGECYILSNCYLSIADLLELFHVETGNKKIKTILPMWFAKGTAPLSELYYRMLNQPPLYTAYSLYTLSSNACFSHEKASLELGYRVRPIAETIRDTVKWLKLHDRI